MCVEAVDKILKVVQEAAASPGEPTDPPEPEESSEGFMMSTEGENTERRFHTGTGFSLHVFTGLVKMN